MLRVNQVKIKMNHSDKELKKATASLLRIPEQDIQSFKIIRQSIDARKKPQIYYSYSLDITAKDEDKILRRFKGKENLVTRESQKIYLFPEPGKRNRRSSTVIVGMGPAGLFCGYFLALHGYRPILLERGKCVEERRRDVEAFWESGRLQPGSNVQFGEGGAGTFSDGKLNTLVKDRDGRNRAVLETFVRFGAPEKICYEAKPHIGTDVLCDIVRRMREEILRLGGQIRFGSKMTGLETEEGNVTGIIVNDCERIHCSQLVLAIGHSARDTFSMLQEKQIPMEAKAFAVGLRVEHPQAMINESQYGTADPDILGAAPYKVAARSRNGRGVYSFCMCPGGYVVNASSEEGHTAVNGMSYSARDGQNANSAIVVTVTPEDFDGSGALAGVEFQRRLERKAWEVGGGKIPVQRYGDFRRNVENAQDEEKGKRMPHPEESSVGDVENPQAVNREGEGMFCTEEQFSGNGSLTADMDKRPERKAPFLPQCKGAYQWADVDKILPGKYNRCIVEGIEAFAGQIRGFNREDACLSGVESRTSSPVRILRGEDMQSKVRGLYPCGEGAGYAGGIVSAAMDGIRVAEQIAKEYAP